MARCKVGVKVMTMIDLVLVKKDMLQYVQDARIVKGIDDGAQTNMSYYVKLC